MPQYVIEARTRFLVAHAESPQRALAWFNDADDIDVDVSPITYGHVQVVGVVDDSVPPVQLLEPGTYEAWSAAHVCPVGATWQPDPWPPRACAKDAPQPLVPAGTAWDAYCQQQRPTRPESTESGKGGYHPISRLVGWLYDVKLEALSAQESKSRPHRDRAFLEIAELAQRCADFVEKHARPVVRPREASHAA